MEQAAKSFYLDLISVKNVFKGRPMGDCLVYFQADIQGYKCSFSIRREVGVNYDIVYSLNYVYIDIMHTTNVITFTDCAFASPKVNKMIGLGAFYRMIIEDHCAERISKHSVRIKALESKVAAYEKAAIALTSIK
jgi:hypothetical protein